MFWGSTPASRSRNEIRPASSVNVVGRVLGDPAIFSRFRSGGIVRIERV
ncbi:MAG: hypothetical protein LM582_09360 [Desulfurococcaceae archaeon]|nr:hypothetical protein [Desulfurococcaceae archaeon]